MNLDRAVIFDLDGTLIDSFPGIASAYEHMLVQMELSSVDAETIRSFVGPPIQEVLHKHFGLSGERLDEGIRHFRNHYGTEGLFRFSKYDGIDEMLASLRGSGYELCIATSKLSTMATKIVENAGWSEHFACIGGALPDGTRHLKRDIIEWILENLAPQVQVKAMVGDRDVDITGARTFGISGIGVTWGYGDKRELIAARAAMIVESPHALCRAIDLLGTTS